MPLSSSSIKTSGNTSKPREAILCDTFQLNVDQIRRLGWHSNITVEFSGPQTDIFVTEKFPQKWKKNITSWSLNACHRLCRNWWTSRERCKTTVQEEKVWESLELVCGYHTVAVCVVPHDNCVVRESYLTSNYAASAALLASHLVGFIFPWNFNILATNPFFLSIVGPSYLIVDLVLSTLPANHLTVQNSKNDLTVHPLSAPSNCLSFSFNI